MTSWKGGRRLTDAEDFLKLSLNHKIHSSSPSQLLLSNFFLSPVMVWGMVSSPGGSPSQFEVFSWKFQPSLLYHLINSSSNYLHVQDVFLLAPLILSSRVHPSSCIRIRNLIFQRRDTLHTYCKNEMKNHMLLNL
jgi:hypothetical protein